MKAYLSAKWRAFTEWAAWAAWNHGRNRAIRARPWQPTEAKQARQDERPEDRRRRANEAAQILENEHFKDAWNALDAEIDARMLGWTGSADQAVRMIECKQLLHGLRREFLRKLDDGYMAQIELNEIERKKRIPRLVR